MELPAELERSFWSELQDCEEAQAMRYVTSVERLGIEKGIEEGIDKGQRRLLLRQIVARFGEPCAAEAAGLLEKVQDPERLEQAGEVIVQCESAAALLERLGPLAG
jgi:hypothetical protein